MKRLEVRQLTSVSQHITHECKVNLSTLSLIHKQFLMLHKKKPSRLFRWLGSLLCYFIWPTDCREGTITDGYRNQLK